MALPETGTTYDLHAEAQEIVARMREGVAGGQEHWLFALLEAIGRWPLAEEQVGDRYYGYLVGGEAFDWLLLAERLCDELDGLIPPEESEDLLFHGRLPVDVSEEEFRRHLGAAKYRAHLNFLYGVRVEEALQLAVHEEVHKERLSRIWENGQVDDEVYQRIYGAARDDLLRTFRRERAPSILRQGSGQASSGQAPSAGSGQVLRAADHLSLQELTEFTYWLFRYRLRHADPARVASDTRKGLAWLARLEARRPRGSRIPGLR